jgi:ATP-dependent helicase IRC3
MTSIQLRDYQREAVAAVEAAETRGVRRPLVVLPTGTGKTVVFAEIIRRRGGRALVIAHREELIAQACDKLRMIMPDLEIGVVKAERDDHRHQVVVASIQTLAHERRLRRLVDPDAPFATIVIDEAHHAAAWTYREAIAVLGGFALDGGPLVVGVTATPERGDRVGLAPVFEEIVYQRDILDMIKAGYLCDLQAVRIMLEVNLDRVEVRGGDFVDADLGDALKEAHAPEHVVEAYRRYADGRKALLFTPTVQLAGEMAEAFSAAGIPAGVVSAETPAAERAATLTALRVGDLRVVANCAVLTEGYDEPTIDCLILARPTKSRPLYVQMIGRGTRRALGKADCLVMDLVGNSERHDLMTVADLFGIDPERLNGRRVTAALAERQQGHITRLDGELVAEEVDLFAGRDLHWSVGQDVYVLSGGGRRQVVIRQEERGWSVMVISPDGTKRIAEGLDLGYAQGMAEDVVRRWRAEHLVRPDAPWRSRPASEKQLITLQKLGCPYRPGLTMSEASDLLNTAFAKAALAPATAKQRWKLRTLGIHVPKDLTKREASELIARRTRGAP